MDADLLPELSGETWVASALIEEFTADLLLARSNEDLITTSHQMQRWRRCGGGFRQNSLRHGRIVLDFLRNCAVGGYKWEICPLTQIAGYGGVERRRRRAHNWWSPGVNDE